MEGQRKAVNKAVEGQGMAARKAVDGQGMAAKKAVEGQRKAVSIRRWAAKKRAVKKAVDGQGNAVSKAAGGQGNAATRTSVHPEASAVSTVEFSVVKPTVVETIRQFRKIVPSKYALSDAQCPAETRPSMREGTTPAGQHAVSHALISLQRFSRPLLVLSPPPFFVACDSDKVPDARRSIIQMRLR